MAQGKRTTEKLKSLAREMLERGENPELVERVLGINLKSYVGQFAVGQRQEDRELLDDEILKVMKLKQSGETELSWLDIAKQLGVNDRTIYRRLKVIRRRSGERGT